MADPSMIILVLTMDYVPLILATFSLGRVMPYDHILDCLCRLRRYAMPIVVYGLDVDQSNTSSNNESPRPDLQYYSELSTDRLHL
nr:hypothetical protein CFP56_03194 [Quercus suber]